MGAKSCTILGMNLKNLGFLLGLVFALVSPNLNAANWYVATNGTGNGTLSSPWSLQNAITNSTIQPGDRVWLRNGTYFPIATFLTYTNNVLGWKPTVSGNSNALVTFASYSNEWAAIDREWYLGAPSLGGYLCFSNLEFYDSLKGHNLTNSSYPSGPWVHFPMGSTPGLQWVNCVIHDVDDCFGNGGGYQVRGCIFWYVGWSDLEHVCYPAPTSFTGNISGWHWNDVIEHSSSNFVMNNNIIFGTGNQNSGVGGGRDTLIDGGGFVTNNYFYDAFAFIPANGYPQTLSYMAGNTYLVSNVIVGPNPVVYNEGISNNFNSCFLDNTVYSNNTNYDAPVVHWFGSSGNNNAFDSNAYFCVGDVGFYTPTLGYGTDFSLWRAYDTNFDVHSFANNATAPANMIYVIPNQDQAKRCNIAIYNFAHSNNISVSLSGILSIGDTYQLYSAQNYKARPIESGTFNGNTISVPMTNLTTAPMLYGTNLNPLGELPSQPPPTSPEFGAFVVIGSASASPTQPALTWATPASITYGTALGTNQLNATASVPGTFAYAPTNGAVLGVGTNSLSVVFTPTDTTDYTSVTNTVNLVVSPAQLTCTANNRTKPYGQTVTFAGTEFTTSGLVNGDTVTNAMLTSSGAVATATAAGSPYAIVPSAAVGTGLNNYAISYVNGSMTVSAATLTVTANNRTKTYGQAVTFAGTEFTATGLQNGDAVSSVTLTSSGAAATATAAGSPYTIVPSAAVGTGLNNYTISYVNGSMTVSAATLTVTANNRTKTYGQTVTFAGTEFAAAGLQNGDVVSSVTLTSSGATATATAAGSPYTIVPSAAVGTGLNNYTISYVNGTMTVSAAPLTVTANSRTRTYGQTVTFAGTEFTATGLQNGDAVSGVTLTSSGGAATATAAGSPYAIVPSGAVGTGLNNYSISYVNGSLTVSAGTLTVTANNRTKTYGQAVTFAGTELSTSGLQGNDAVSSVTLTSAGASATAAAGAAYSIVPSAAAGAGLNNYTISYVNGTLTVGQGTPNLTWTNPAPIMYGTPLNTNELSAAADVPGTFIYNPTNGSVLYTGTNTLSVTFTPTDTANYSSASSAVSLFVSNAILTVTATNVMREFGEPNPVFTGIITGLTNNDNITATYTTVATTNSPAGTYAIVPALVDTNNLETNYIVNLTNGVLTIETAPLPPTDLHVVTP